MHPIFATAGEAVATPIWFIHAGNVGSAATRASTEHAQRLHRRRRFEPKPGRLLLLPAPTASSPARCSGLEGADEPIERSCSARGSSSSLLPPGHLPFRQCAA